MSGNGNGNDSGTKRCALCGHPEWHNNGNTTCLFWGIPKQYVVKLTKDVTTKKKAKTLQKAYTDKVDSDMDREAIMQVIEEVRNEHL